jgi:formate dehydrogenase subunit beta
MTHTSALCIENDNIVLSVQNFLKSILELDDIEAMLVPLHKKSNNRIMPELVSDPSLLEHADPFAPAFTLNAAKLVSRLTHKPMGKKIAVVLRPCEIRALIELVKLKQASTEDLFIIGTDCPGAYTNKDLAQVMASGPEDLTQRFCENALAGKEPPIKGGPELSSACRACEKPVPENADLLIGLFGEDIKKQLLLSALTENGTILLEKLSYPESAPPSERENIIAEVITARIAFRDQMFGAVHEATNTLEKLSDYFNGCINCYNCRVACPVCYCRECVFNTDVFDHDPFQYLQWARRKGSVKMPTDTSFYHITRLTHISLTCVGCGQCANACPNDIPVMDLFKYIAAKTQAAFEYEAGQDIKQPPPLSVFKEEEYPDVVGVL